MEYINIVDKDNNLTPIIKEKKQAHTDGEFHRTVHIWVINDKGEILLERRSPNKSNHPNQWDMSAAGHIEAGEKILDAAKRELKEELGIEVENKDFKFLGIQKRNIPTNKEFQYIYVINTTTKIEEYIFEDGEVSEVKYVSKRDFLKLMLENPKDVHVNKEMAKLLLEYISNKVIVIPANINHKDFIINANKEINQTNNTQLSTHLEEWIETDLYTDFPKFKCLVAEINGKPVGMILYSFLYWANDGEVLWISEMFVEKDYRKNGVFFRLIQKLRDENPNIHIVSCATGKDNTRIQRIIEYYGAKSMDLKFYYIKK